MSDLKDRLHEVRLNPSLMQQLSQDLLEEQLDREQYDIPDPTNPFVFLMENNAVNTAMGISEQESILCRLYPRMSRNFENLYLHMSDQNYVGRFSSPAEAIFDFYLALDEIKAKAVPTNINGVRKLVIPRFTKVSIAGTTYTMQYPIEIRIPRHGGLLVMYDIKQTSPVKTMTSNLVDWEILNIAGTKCVKLSVPMQQFDITTYHPEVDISKGVSIDYTFTDKFYHCRVYHKSGNATEWTEIKTTHTDQVFDAYTPTALLQVRENVMNLKLPNVYIDGPARIDGNLRVDIYTTKGKISTDLGSYMPENFVYDLKDINNDLDKYSAPLSSSEYLQVVSTAMVDGGTNGKTFLELREEVINNTLGANDIPVSLPQLGSHLNDLGFNVVKSVDNISSQQFLATRQLPRPSNNTLSSGMGTVMTTLRYTLKDLAKYQNVIDNGDRLTLSPKVLYELSNGITHIVPKSEIDRLRTLNPDALAREVNTRRYLYSPFYYVIDTENNGFQFRAYSLDDPKVKHKTLVDDNETTNIQSRITAYEVSKTDTGYRVTVGIDDSEGYLEEIGVHNVILQASYNPRKEHNWCAKNATYVGRSKDGLMSFEVDIVTNYDITHHDELRTLGFSMYSSDQDRYGIQLEDDLDLTLIVLNQDTTDYRPGKIDQMIQAHLFNGEGGYKCITRERLRLVLGKSLTSLWRPHRTVVTERDYLRYEEDVPYAFDRDILEVDKNGDVIFDEKDGKLFNRVLHRKGEPKLNADGKVVIQHRKGDVRYDTNGLAMMRHDRERLLEMTILLSDGVFFFVTDEEALRYRRYSVSSMTTWVDELKALDSRLLDDNTKVFLHPTQTIGDTHAIIVDGQSAVVPIDQALTVNYYVTDNASRNSDFREAISTSTRHAVADCLGKQTASISDITSTLRSMVGDDVIALDVIGLGGSLNVSTITMTDDAARLAMGKRLVVRSNRTLAVEDAIDINYIRHSL